MDGNSGAMLQGDREKEGGVSPETEYMAKIPKSEGGDQLGRKWNHYSRMERKGRRREKRRKAKRVGEGVRTSKERGAGQNPLTAGYHATLPCPTSPRGCCPLSQFAFTILYILLVFYISSFLDLLQYYPSSFSLVSHEVEYFWREV